MAIPAPLAWDAHAAIAPLPLIPWQGSAWRMHKRKYPATDPGGSLKVSGRYNRGADKFAPGDVWPALYLSCSAEVCLGEIIRHVSSPAQLAALNDFQLSELTLRLRQVLDCRDVVALGLQPQDLLHETDYTVSQELAAAAIGKRAEALWVLSATDLGDNLIVLTALLHPDSVVELVGSRSPNLYVPRSAASV